jgi:hypothetical protein
MKKYTTTVFLLFCAIVMQAQTFNIKGKLTDEAGSGLPSATVLLLNARDSVMSNYALSNTDGVFEVRNVRKGDYLLRLSYIGFTTITLPIVTPETTTLELGNIALSSQATLLGEVTIQQERIPMKVKNDTIEYDALSFKPLPNEMVEDLLKRMPGMVISSDGTVEAQGETVRRVLVDGKEFFGRDPKMATQNIPADAISKVHVFDQRSEQSLFTGIDDGQRERTLNLELKEDRKEAMFGNTSLGYGPDNHFQGRTNLNRFDSKGQLSILGMGNNVNQQGFSIGDYMNFSGGTQSVARGGGVQIGGRSDNSVPLNFDGRPSSNGLITSWAGGVNFNRTLKTGTEITSSYFYNQLNHEMNEDLSRENFLPEGNYNYAQNSLQDNQNYNHRVNLRVDHKFNENSSLLFTGNTALNETNTFGSSSSQTFAIDGNLQNKSVQGSEADGRKLDMSGRLLYRQRLGKPGRTLTAEVDMNRGQNKQDAGLRAENTFYREQGTLIEDILQNQNRRDMNSRVSTDITYTEPLTQQLFLEGNYNLAYSLDEVNLRVFDVDNPDDTGDLNDMLSNHYDNIYTYQKAGLNLRFNREKFNISVGNAYQVTGLKGYSYSLDEDVSRDYNYHLPTARFNYQFSNFRRFSAEYETSVNEPSALQIQPITDNRNPLNIYKGNPDLLPSYRHRFQLRFNTFDPVRMFGIFANATADYTTNDITNSVNVDESLIRTTMPVNVDNNINLRANLNFNIGVDKIKSRFMLGSSIRRSQSVNVLNNTNQEIVNNTISPNFRYIFRPVDEFEVMLAANFNNQITTYKFSNTEQAFLNQTYNSNASWTFLKNYRLQTSYNYSIYQGRTSEFDRKVPMLDLSFARSFLKNNSGELKLSVFNLLDSELGITQTNNVNYYERSVTNSLGRYFLLSFTWSLNQQLNMMSGSGPGRGRGMMMH